MIEYIVQIDFIRKNQEDVKSTGFKDYLYTDPYIKFIEVEKKDLNQEYFYKLTLEIFLDYYNDLKGCFYSDYFDDPDLILSRLFFHFNRMEMENKSEWDEFIVIITGDEEFGQKNYIESDIIKIKFSNKERKPAKLETYLTGKNVSLRNLASKFLKGYRK